MGRNSRKNKQKHMSRCGKARTLSRKAAIEAGSLRTKPYPQTVAERKAAWSDISSSGNSNDETNTARGIKQEARYQLLINSAARILQRSKK